jgi:hypothetical protein
VKLRVFLQHSICPGDQTDPRASLLTEQISVSGREKAIGCEDGPRIQTDKYLGLFLTLLNFDVQLNIA